MPPEGRAAGDRATRKLSCGAEVRGEATHFRVWAPGKLGVLVVPVQGRVSSRHGIALESEGDGYFSALVPGLGAGDRYRYRIGDAEVPDPVSRFQPEGPHGPSEIVDPGAFTWTDVDFPGCALAGSVIYELHVGTFTREGTYDAAARELPELRRLGITTIELMPLADFPGQFGWGYDGVDLYAPSRLYGRPDDLRRFVDIAHSLGLSVILDVVYNHLGPSGNYLRAFDADYFTEKYENEWGDALNFEGPRAVRDFFVENAGYWIDEFHFDGLRLDATQSVHDASEPHVLTDIGERARRAGKGKAILLVAENEPQDSNLISAPSAGGHGLSALWNDDFHHAARVALTGRREAYFSDTRGVAQELISALKWGFLFQGQQYAWQKSPRGAPALDRPAASFVLYLENHDQVANSGLRQRLSALTTPGRLRAMTALLLLAPGTPMLFQGQEFATSSPFFYFADHEASLAPLVDKGRREFLAQFKSLATEAAQRAVPAPHDRATFERCKLDFRERDTHRPFYQMVETLLRLRREDAVIARQDKDRLHGSVIDDTAFLLRYLGDEGDDRLLIVNLGPTRDLASLAEPLLARPRGRSWRLVFSSESPDYGGAGAVAPMPDRELHVPGHAALFFAAVPAEAP